MKQGTLYAKRVKRLFSKLKGEHGKQEIPDPSDPLDQLIVGLFSYRSSDQRAQRAAKALREAMVDINEVRVSTNAEIAAAMGNHLSDSLDRADAVRRALNAIFMKEHAVDLSNLNKLGRREARQYLENLDGVEPCAAASVVLWSLGGHAIPVDERMYETLRKEEMVEPSATIETVQAFLERNVSANDAKLFVILMQKFTIAKAPRGSSSAPSTSAPRKRKAASKSPVSGRSAARSRK